MNILTSELIETIKNESPTPEDYEGYVYNCLLWDDGESGADYYNVSAKEFENSVLNALSMI